ncbi:MAG: hypothetical protein JW934_19875 [Anaerolineae bacterium]|nr:hypothetical protein [Anaerolineae bacterium]
METCHSTDQKHNSGDVEPSLPSIEEIMATYDLDDPQVAAEIRRWKERRVRWPWAFQDERD